MRERLLWSILAVLTLLLVLGQAQSPNRPDAQVGRYQIVTVAGNTNEEAQVFRIDTVTGKTWQKAYLIKGTAKQAAWGTMSDPTFTSPKN
jgi:hypothetical protein